MTKKSILLFAFIAIIAITIISCGKTATEDTSNPSITISSPTEGQTFMQMTSTDSATVSVHITDEDLHAYSLVITKASGGDTLLYIPETHDEVNDLTVNKKFPLGVVLGTVAYKVTVTAEDHNGNEGEAKRNFSIEHM